MKLNKNNLIVYAAKHYYNPKHIDGEEFFDDVIFNVFGHEAGVEMLAAKIPLEQWPTLKPFLVFLRAIKNDDITGIKMDKYVISKLRELRWES